MSKKRDAELVGFDRAVDVVKRRLAHYELYRTGDMMRTKDATFAILEEILDLLAATRLRIEEGASTR